MYIQWNIFAPPIYITRTQYGVSDAMPDHGHGPVHYLMDYGTHLALLRLQKKDTPPCHSFSIKGASPHRYSSNNLIRLGAS